MDDRISSVTHDTYKETNLALVFNQVRWKKATRQEWVAAFDIFFPPLGAPPRLQPQNFPTMLYWIKWADMKMHLPKSQVKKIRETYWELFNELHWVPQPHSDRLWKYAPQGDFQVQPPGWKLPAPHVLMHPRANRPTWEVQDRHGDADVGHYEEEEVDDMNERVNPAIAPIPRHILLREEEEESSDSD